MGVLDEEQKSSPAFVCSLQPTATATVPCRLRLGNFMGTENQRQTGFSPQTPALPHPGLSSGGVTATAPLPPLSSAHAWLMLCSQQLLWDWLSTITQGHLQALHRSNNMTNPGRACCWGRMRLVIYIFIPTRYVIYLFISRVCLGSQGRTSDSWCTGVCAGDLGLAVLCRGEARADEGVKYGNKSQKYSSNWTKSFGDKLF